MLEPPALRDDEISACLANAFGLRLKRIDFLPLGADLDTAVYRIIGQNEAQYFLKLRRGNFHKATVLLPNFLARANFMQIIPALTTRTGQLWGYLDTFKMILYPYIEGHHGFEEKLSPQIWEEFGSTLKSFHAAQVPTDITSGLPQEYFTPEWPGLVKSHLTSIGMNRYKDPVANEMATFLLDKRAVTLDLVRLAESLAEALRTHTPKYTLCHGDIHGWNLLIDDAGALYLVDWDTLIFAPKERDLMFIGAGLGDSGYSPQEEEAMFYHGYGPVEINTTALAYYRCQRIIEDIGIYCQQIFMSREGGRNRRQWLAQLTSNYRPGGTIELACQTIPD